MALRRVDWGMWYFRAREKTSRGREGARRGNRGAPYYSAPRQRRPRWRRPRTSHSRSPAIRPPAIARSAMRSSTTNRDGLHLNAGRARPSSRRPSRPAPSPSCMRCLARRASHAPAGGRGDGHRAAGGGTAAGIGLREARYGHPTPPASAIRKSSPRRNCTARACRLRVGVPVKWPLAPTGSAQITDAGASAAAGTGRRRRDAPEAHRARLGAAPRPHRVPRRLARRSGGAPGRTG
jgi:hypothetical protein